MKKLLFLALQFKHRICRNEYKIDRSAWKKQKNIDCPRRSDCGECAKNMSRKISQGALKSPSSSFLLLSVFAPPHSIYLNAWSKLPKNTERRGEADTTGNTPVFAGDNSSRDLSKMVTMTIGTDTSLNCWSKIVIIIPWMLRFRIKLLIVIIIPWMFRFRTARQPTTKQQVRKHNNILKSLQENSWCLESDPKTSVVPLSMCWQHHLRRK